MRAREFAPYSRGPLARSLNKLGLKKAILLSCTAAMVVMLAAVFFLVRRQVSNYLMRGLSLHGQAISREVKANLKRDRPLPELATTLGAIVDVDPRIRAIALVAENGKLLASSRGASPIITPLAGRISDLRAEHSHLEAHELIYAEGVSSEDGRTLLVVLNRAPIDDQMALLARTVAVAFFIGFGLFLLVLWAISRVFLLEPLTDMMSVANRLAQSDLSVRTEVESDDELGKLAGALNQISESLRETMGRVRGVSEGVAQVIEQISRSGNTVSGGASTILTRVEETSSSMTEMMASLRGIAENVEVLYQSAEESSSSIMQMAATNDEVAQNVEQMAGSVEETTSAIGEMAASIKEVARAIEELLRSTEDTSSSMNDMDVSIGQVETNANETARLSEQVSQDAATGVEALQNTLEGIAKIKESSQVASGVIESLGKRTSEIGNILDVIDDVAEQTNLLALNAAIIAAQAGEHGKGFAVVAEEIKDLAERTGDSTKEIAELIGAVQEESRNAVVAMNQGVRNVEAGVQLGREAEDALRKIFESANKSTLMVKAIARATVEQARGSRAVTGSIQRIAETVQQISKASNEQARGSEQIMKSAEKMKLFTSHVQRSSHEQAHGSRQITKSISNINEMVTHLNRAQKEQTVGSEQVLKAVEAIKGVSEHQARSARQLEDAIDSLQKQAEVLRAEVRRFRV